MQMNKWILVFSFVLNVFFFSRASATPPSQEDPSLSDVESLVKSYVDKDFVHEELSPPEQCGQYAEKLMFAYDWNVVIHKIGPYDPARKLLPVEATVIVRCGPFQPESQPRGEADASDLPLRSETPIDFQMILDPENSQKWKIHEVTLWKSKQKVLER
jgi:hypothetical protein